MKLLATACLMALVPVGATAADSSPRSRCLEKLVRLQESMFQQMARAGEAGSRSQSVRTSTYGEIDFRNPYSVATSSWSTSTTVLPPHNSTMLRELRLLEARKSECARLPDSDEGALRTVVGRGGATKRLKRAQEEGK
jgi:hypothetical protein